MTFFAADVTNHRPEPKRGPLKNPINTDEVTAAIATLKDDRAIDSEGMFSELFKFTATPLSKLLPVLFNNIFTEGQHITSLADGILIPLNKPKKPKTVENTRPITIVTTIRKLLSTILRERIVDKAEKFIAPSQSGFRRGRSTADIVWAYRWLDATVHRYQQSCIHMLGLDLSKAFDTVPRDKLREVLLDNGIMDDDELRILDELMDEIRLQARVNGEYGETFKSTLGIPQGDSLSPLLFIINLEAALRDFRAFIDDTSMEECVYVETQYADDADFISQTEHTLDFILVNAPHMLAKWHLKVNGDKTERYKLERGATCTTKKLGSYLDQAKDIRHRTGMANAAFHRM
jgi:hypothetical protein